MIHLYSFIAHDLSVVEHLSHEVAVMYAGKIVEFAPVEEIFSSPLHPYTQALISAREDRKTRERYAMKGEIISPINPPRGCRLRKRCPRSKRICSEQEPELINVGNEHFVSCLAL